MVIQTKDLTKNFKGKCAVDRINLEVAKRDIFGFIGPNGAGKTTTINLLLAISYPSSGSIKIFGEELSIHWRSIKQRIGYMPQGSPLYPDMTGVAFLDFCAGFFPKVNYQLRDSLLSRFNLPLDRKIKTYSGGMRQQLSLIQALQHEPELLILDEPTSGLDPLARDQFYKIIKELRDGGTTIFFSTHILTEIGRVCDTVCIIKQGRIIEEQRLDILRSKADRYIEITLREEVTKDTFCVPGITEVVRESPVKFTLTVTKQNENEVLSYIKKLPLISFNIKDIGLDQLFLKYFPEHDATKGSEK